jgi:hypothetical protein
MAETASDTGAFLDPHTSDRRFREEFVALWPPLVEWVRPHYDHVHLFHTVKWLLVVEPDASEALLVAALTHDMERHFPGGTQPDKAAGAWDDPEYNLMHGRRSADVVIPWLRRHGAPADLIRDVETPIVEHELGGSPESNLVQAADSLSFLDVNGRLVSSWVLKGETSLEYGIRKLDWMYERISLPEARELARPLHEQAVAWVREDVAAAAAAR